MTSICWTETFMFNLHEKQNQNDYGAPPLFGCSSFGIQYIRICSPYMEAFFSFRTFRIRLALGMRGALSPLPPNMFRARCLGVGTSFPSVSADKILYALLVS